MRLILLHFSNAFFNITKKMGSSFQRRRPGVCKSSLILPIVCIPLSSLQHFRACIPPKSRLYAAGLSRTPDSAQNYFYMFKRQTLLPDIQPLVLDMGSVQSSARLQDKNAKETKSFGSYKIESFKAAAINPKTEKNRARGSSVCLFRCLSARNIFNTDLSFQKF